MATVSDAVHLPPGFRFHPTDEEIITHYLSLKVVNPTFTATAVGEVDLNKCEPWDLPSKAKMGEKDWYFFCHRDRKYPTGTRTNRATESGYWKATGKDKEIFRGKGVLVGMKKTLVFYMGRAPKGEKTNWVMHEFKLEGKQQQFIRSAKDEWVVSKVFNKSTGATTNKSSIARTNSYGEELSPLMDPTRFNSIRPELSPIARMNSYGEELSPLMDPTLFNSIRPELSSIARINIYGEELSPLIDPTLFNSVRPELSYANNVVDLDYGLPIIHHQMGIFNGPQTSGFHPQIQTSTPYFPLPSVPSMTCLHQDRSLMRTLARTTQ